jgi:hypothetical protein
MRPLDPTATVPGCTPRKRRKARANAAQQAAPAPEAPAAIPPVSEAAPEPSSLEDVKRLAQAIRRVLDSL